MTMISINKLRKQQISRLIISKCIELLNRALESDEYAIEFRDKLYISYNTSILIRAELFKNFYLTYKNVLGLKLSSERFEQGDNMWPFNIDNMVSKLFTNHLTKKQIKNYKEKKDQVWDKLYDIDNNSIYSDFFELMFSEFHNDLFYAIALELANEDPGILNVK